MWVWKTCHWNSYFTCSWSWGAMKSPNKVAMKLWYQTFSGETGEKLLILVGEIWSCLLVFPVNGVTEWYRAAQHRDRSSKGGDKVVVSMLGCSGADLYQWPCLSSGLGLLCRTSNTTGNMLPTDCAVCFFDLLLFCSAPLTPPGKKDEPW